MIKLYKLVVILIFALLVSPGLMNAQGWWNYSKDRACKLWDGMYSYNIEIKNYPWFSTEVKNFVKSNWALYYVVNASNINDAKYREYSLYSWNCKTKKVKMLTNFNFDWDWIAEIDALDTGFIVVRIKYGTLLWSTSPALYYKHFVYNRTSLSVRDLELWRDIKSFSEFTRGFNNFYVYERSAIITDVKPTRIPGIWDIYFVYDSTWKGEQVQTFYPTLNKPLYIRIDYNKGGVML